MVETITIDGTVYSTDELEALLGVDALEPPYDIPAIQQAITEANREDNALAELLAALLLLGVVAGIPQNRTAYATRQAQYYRGGRALTQIDLQQRVSGESQRNTARMQRLTQRMLDGDVSLEQWQRRMGADIVRSQFRMAQAGAGTAGQLTPAHLNALRARLRGELDSLARLAGQLRGGEISERMALYRAGRYGGNAGAAFWEAQHVSHSDGRWEGRRTLGPNLNHCPDCPGLVQPDWVPAENVVPKGSQCRCGGRCYCQVFYRQVRLSDRLPIG